MVFIRAAEAKDIPSLQTLFLQLGYQTETAILAQRITATQSMMSALVAETENAVCGVIVINFILPVHENRLWALISALVIEESSRGSGIGQQLLQAAERLALPFFAAVSIAQIAVDPRNDAAHEGDAKILHRHARAVNQLTHFIYQWQHGT